MKETDGGKSPAPAWMPQIDAEEKQDLAEAQSIACDRSLHLLLTNYQQGPICPRQGSSDVGRGVRIPRLENIPAGLTVQVQL